jgi:hypothetical protein
MSSTKPVLAKLAGAPETVVQLVESTTARTVAPNVTERNSSAYVSRAATEAAPADGTNVTLPSFKEQVKISEYFAGAVFGSGAGRSVARDVTVPLGNTVVLTKSNT